ncbi:MAG: phytoene desaturase family protein [Myxococcota bacterium]
MADAIVVGAGLGGLAAAIELAAKGWRVRVLEAGPMPGGKAGVAVLDGVEVDTGPSVLTLPDVLDAVLRAGGSSLDAELTLTRPAPAFRYVWPGGDTLDVHDAPDATLANVRAAFGVAAAEELAGFLAYARRIWEAAAPSFVLGPAPSFGGLLRHGPAVFGLLADIDGTRAMHAAIRARVRHPRLRDVLGRYATYNGSDPRVAPATLNCIAHVELGLGGVGVRGGVYAIVRALVRVAQRLGVSFRYDAPVTRIRVGAGRVVGVDTAEGPLDARVVVLNADVGALAAGLLAAEAGVSVEEPRSMSGWTAILRARRRHGADACVAHTVLFPERPYLEEFADVFDRDRPPAEPTVYLCARRAHRLPLRPGGLPRARRLGRRRARLRHGERPRRAPRRPA